MWVDGLGVRDSKKSGRSSGASGENLTTAVEESYPSSSSSSSPITYMSLIRPNTAGLHYSWGLLIEKT